MKNHHNQQLIVERLKSLQWRLFAMKSFDFSFHWSFRNRKKISSTEQWWSFLCASPPFILNNSRILGKVETFKRFINFPGIVSCPTQQTHLTEECNDRIFCCPWFSAYFLGVQLPFVYKVKLLSIFLTFPSQESLQSYLQQTSYFTVRLLNRS